MNHQLAFDQLPRAGPVAHRRSVRSRAQMQAVQTAMHTVPGLKDALDGKRYKAVLLDQFGVMHDGRKAHASAIRTVRELHARGVRVYILSNSSRRSTGCISKLETMGFEPQWFAGITLPANFHHHHHV
jgi:FMN phosphatase YigB (HAD superfamily)